MTTAQKIIKYLATAFAIFLIITIISTILGVLYGLSGILGLKSDNKMQNVEMSTTNFENNDIKTLEIDVVSANLIIKTGETLRVDTNDSNINCKQNNKKLEIKEKDNWFSHNENQDLIIYIPRNLEFEKVEINTGAGKINIEKLDAKTLELELGAGETKIENLNISKECNIEGGAGKVDILNGEISNLDLDMGIGEINLSSILTGKSEINAGIGNLNIDLQEDIESYKIKANKGIGSIKINGKEISNGEVYGDGKNYIKIDGGIGSIKINFEDVEEML